MHYLRGRLSGLGIPHFALDTPKGGKIELLPNAIVKQTKTHTVLKTSTGETIQYPEPMH
jgi:lysine 2,3-aminomutase